MLRMSRGNGLKPAVRRVGAALAAVAMLAGAWSFAPGTASALPLAPGVTSSAFDTVTLVAPLGIPFISPIVQTSGPLVPPLTGAVLSAAVPFMGGLLFEYQIDILSEKSGINHIALRAGDDPWLGINITNFGYIISGGDSAPSSVRRATVADGAGLDVFFDPSITPPPKNSVVFWFLTDAPSSRLDDLGVQDGQQGVASALQPVPEPSRVVGMLGFAIMLGVGAVWQLRRKAVRA